MGLPPGNPESFPHCVSAGAPQVSRELPVQPLDPRDQRIAQLEAYVAKLLAELAVANARIAELEARLNQNSSNSSKPPSSDPPGAPREGKKPSGRKPGGQPGHKRHERTRLAPDRVEDLKPPRCTGCGDALCGEDPDPLWHQVVEVPPIKPFVVEFRLHALECKGCGKTVRAQLPHGVPSRGFGPMLTAMVALASGKYRLSKRMVEELFSDLLNVDLSLGSVCNLEQEMSDATAAPVEEARTYVRKQPNANLDETGWYEGRKNGRAGRAWLWTAVTNLVTVFVISLSRGAAVAQEILGADYPGLVSSDRWSGYNWLPTAHRQLCWAHLIRDFQGFVNRGGEGAVIGEALLARTKDMFEWRNRVRDKTLDREIYERWMEHLESDVLRLLRKAEVCPEKKTAGMAREMLKLKEALFTFVKNEIEPTNNTAEHAVRKGVMWRKTSFGTHSPEGSRFVERMLTITATLRQQKRPVLAFLAECYQAWLTDSAPPSLLPAVEERA